MWKKVDGFPNYEVSDIGEIKNTKTGKVLAPKKSKDGYLRVTLSDNGFQKTTGIHRLVAIAFIQNPENKATVNHKNEIKNDNRAENLEWATNAQSAEQLAQKYQTALPKGIDVEYREVAKNETTVG